MKLCLERRIGKRIPPKHPIVAWLVTHCAALIRYRVRGFDGKTPYERVRMRPFGSRLVCFAEKVMYKDRAKEKTDDEHRWHRGIFLGMCAMTGQYTLYDEEKKVVKQARTIKLVPDQQKWDVELIEEVASTPYNEHAGHEQEVAFQDRPSRPEDEDPAKKIAKSRRIYIKGEDIKAFGYTVGCPKCDHERRYGPGRTTKGHSDLCRRRIIDELMKTPEGLRRIQNADERLTRTLAEHVEAQAQGPQDHGGGEMQLEACPWCPLHLWMIFDSMISRKMLSSQHHRMRMRAMAEICMNQVVTVMSNPRPMGGILATSTTRSTTIWMWQMSLSEN